MLGLRELARVVFPVGDVTKGAVRAHATRLGLRTATKPESMDVCFIRKGARRSFLEARVPMRAGRIVGTDGTELGSHPGIAAFTVGQRRGVGVATGERTYVVDIDAASGTLTLGSHADLLRDELVLRDMAFVDPVTRVRKRDVLVQVRAHGEALAAHLTGDVVRFRTPQPRVARGQVVAFYDDDVLLGGGIAA
jgi:tRNA-specific 2-thiouridylase